MHFSDQSFYLKVKINEKNYFNGIHLNDIVKLKTERKNKLFVIQTNKGGGRKTITFLVVFYY